MLHIEIVIKTCISSRTDIKFHIFVQLLDSRRHDMRSTVTDGLYIQFTHYFTVC